MLQMKRDLWGIGGILGVLRVLRVAHQISHAIVVRLWAGLRVQRSRKFAGLIGARANPQTSQEPGWSGPPSIRERDRVG